GADPGAQTVDGRERPEPQQVGGRRERPQPSVCQHTDGARAPVELGGEAELVDQLDDVALVREHVVVEALERCAAHFEADDQPTETVGPLCQHDVVAALGESKGGRGAGDAAAHDDDAVAQAAGGTRETAALPAVVLWSWRYMRTSSLNALVTTLTLAP